MKEQFVNSKEGDNLTWKTQVFLSNQLSFACDMKHESDTNDDLQIASQCSVNSVSISLRNHRRLGNRDCILVENLCAQLDLLRSLLEEQEGDVAYACQSVHVMSVVPPIDCHGESIPRLTSILQKKESKILLKQSV